MTETLAVANAGRSDLTLPCGTRVPAGRTVDVAVERLREHAAHPVVRHWFEERILRADGPLPLPVGAGATGCDCAAIQARLAEVEDALAAERAACARAFAERDAARDEADTAAVERAAEAKARAEAEGLLKLAQEEIDALKAAAVEAAKGKAGK